MTQPTDRHTAVELSLPRLTVRASFWPDENGGPLNSVLTVRTGCAHLQEDVSEANLRELASLLIYHANQLKEATAARDSLTPCTTSI